MISALKDGLLQKSCSTLCCQNSASTTVVISGGTKSLIPTIIKACLYLTDGHNMHSSLKIDTFAVGRIVHLTLPHIPLKSIYKPKTIHYIKSWPIMAHSTRILNVYLECQIWNWL